MDFSWAETAAVTGFVYTHLVRAAMFSVMASSTLSSLASALYVCSKSMSGDTALWFSSALRPTKAKSSVQHCFVYLWGCLRQPLHLGKVQWQGLLAILGHYRIGPKFEHVRLKRTHIGPADASESM